MGEQQQRGAWFFRLAGLVCLLACLAGNKTFLEQVLSDDRQLSDAKYTYAIFALQGLFLLMGMALLFRVTPGKVRGVLAVPAILAAGFVIVLGAMGAKQIYAPSSEDELFARIDRSGEIYLALSGRETKTLSKSAMNLRLPYSGAKGVFADSVVVADLVDAPPKPGDANPSLGIQEMVWKAGEKKTVAKDEMDLWQPMFKYVDYFDYAKVYIIFSNFAS